MTATPRLYGKSALLMDVKLQVAGIGVIIRGYMVHFSGSGLSFLRSRYTRQKCGHVVSRLCMTYSEELRTAESDLRLQYEMEYSFGDFMARNTPYFQGKTLISTSLRLRLVL